MIYLFLASALSGTCCRALQVPIYCSRFGCYGEADVECLRISSKEIFVECDILALTCLFVTCLLLAFPCSSYLRASKGDWEDDEGKVVVVFLKV